jgi:hypothetical protein
MLMSKRWVIELHSIRFTGAIRLTPLDCHLVHVLQASKLLRTRVAELAGMDTRPFVRNDPTARALTQAQTEDEAEAEMGLEADDMDSSMDYPDGTEGSDFDHYAWVKSAVKASSKAVYHTPNAKRFSGRESNSPQQAGKPHFAKVRSEGVGRRHPAGSGEENVPAVSKSGSPAARRKSRRVTDPHPSADGEAEDGEGEQARSPRQSLVRALSGKTPRYRASVSFGREQRLQAEKEDGIAVPRTAEEDLKIRAMRRRSRGMSARGTSLKAVSPRAGEAAEDEGEGEAETPRRALGRGRSTRSPSHSVSFGREQSAGSDGEPASETEQAADRPVSRSRGMSARGLSLKAVSSRGEEAVQDEGSARTSRHRARQSVSVGRQQDPQMEEEEELASARTAEHDSEARAARRHQSVSARASSVGRSAGLVDLESWSTGGGGSERGLSMRQSRRGQSAATRRSPTNEAEVEAAPLSAQVRRRGREEDTGVEETYID